MTLRGGLAMRGGLLTAARHPLLPPPPDPAFGPPPADPTVRHSALPLLPFDPALGVPTPPPAPDTGYAPLPLPPPLTLPPSSPLLVPSSSASARVDREYPSLQGAIGVGCMQAAPPSRPHVQGAPGPPPPSAPPSSRLLLSSPLLFIFSVDSNQSWISPACTAVPPPEPLWVAGIPTCTGQ